jgi:SAM-dependent methyltransferase
MSYVFATTAHAPELERLRALEAAFDPPTRRWLRDAAGLAEGWRCVEVGAGAGSIAAWLAAEVGGGGEVAALDIDARFLAGLGAPNLRVVEADVRRAPLPAGEHDLAHARFVLIHQADAASAVRAMLGLVRPGGWLALEEPDFSAARALAGPPELRAAFERVHRAIAAMFAARGMDHAYGARIPVLLQELGLEAITVENDAPLDRGGGPIARMMAMSTRQLGAKYLATGLCSEADLDGYAAFAADPSCWATYHGTVRGAGSRPR